MYSASLLLAALVTLEAQQALSHMIMVEPHPYNLDTGELYQIGTLNEQLKFPCQGRYDQAEHITAVTAGEKQLVKFWGSAVHGSGSCQFSVAYGETPPDDIEQWRTIYSIQGGCPAEAEGNLETTGTDPHGRVHAKECGDDEGTECVRQFNIPIPKGMKNGRATFAWTWFNQLGNREMYMTCAPIEIKGGKDDMSFVDTLPPIFVANIPGQCTTGNSGSIIGFPDPGNYGRVYKDMAEGSQGTCEAGVVPDFKDNDETSPDIPTPSSEPPMSLSPIESGPPAGFSIAPVPPTTTAPSEIAHPTEPAATPSSSSAPVETPVVDELPEWAKDFPPCERDSQVICIDGGFYGICDGGWATPQKLSNGTACVDGKIEAKQI